MSEKWEEFYTPEELRAVQAVQREMPGKIFEYMAFGKPIISTYSIPDEACIPYLQRYPLSLLVEEAESEIERTAQVIVVFIHDSNGKQINSEKIRNIFRNNLPETFIKEVFEKL